MNLRDVPPIFSTAMRFTQARYEFDPSTATLWSYMRPSPRPSFTPAMLAEMESVESAIERAGGVIEHEGTQHQVAHIVFASDSAGVWNLGGDLATFAAAIRKSDVERLRDYGRICVRGMHRRHRGFGADTTTISLVQGDALGGGFEGVLASDIIVAEPQSRFGFPEMLFNLFPGMGALTFLSRRIGLRAAQQIVIGAATFGAEAMRGMGVVDLVADDSRQAVRELLAKRQVRANGHRAIAAAARLIDPVSLVELEAIVDIWAEAALRLTESDLARMEKLVRRQDRLVARGRDSTGEEPLVCA